MLADGIVYYSKSKEQTGAILERWQNALKREERYEGQKTEEAYITEREGE